MKKYIAAVLLILLLVVLGIFYYEKHFIKVSNQQAFASDFVVTTTDTQKIITNKKAGMTMSVPSEWKIQPQDNPQNPISFYPDIKKSCKITTSVRPSDFKNNTDIKNFFNTDEDYKVGISVEDKEINDINFHGNDAVKVYLLETKDSYTRGVYFLKNYYKYNYILYGDVSEKYNCDSLFQNYLDSVKFE